MLKAWYLETPGKTVEGWEEDREVLGWMAEHKGIEVREEKRERSTHPSTHLPTHPPTYLYVCVCGRLRSPTHPPTHPPTSPTKQEKIQALMRSCVAQQVANLAGNNPQGAVDGLVHVLKELPAEHKASLLEMLKGSL